MDAHTLQLFQRKAIKSKKEIIDALDEYSAHLVHDKEHSSDAIFYRPALIEMIDRFKKAVQDRDLIYLENPFASYEIVITNIDVRLNSVEYTDIVFNESGEVESTESSVYPPTICIDANFITAEEYAQRFSIDVETVVGWIEDRKIKCAKKEPSGWRVVETQNFPDQDSRSGSYVFIGANGDLSQFAPLHKGTQVFTALQLENDNGLYDAMSFDLNDRLIEHKQIESEELQSLENALIRSREVVFGNTFVEVIDEKVIPGYENNPFLVAEEKILTFVNQLGLPQETKSMLKTMAQSNCGEALFIAALEKLSLEEEFSAYMHGNTP